MAISIEELKRQVVLAPGDSDLRFLLGEAHFLAQEYANAVKQLEKTLALNPDHTDACRLLVRIHEKEERPVQAVRCLEALARRTPADLSLRNELVELLLSVGRPDDALMHAEEARRMGPPEAARLMLIAELYRSKRLWQKARTALEEAQRAEPHNQQIASALRQTYLEMGDDARSDRVAGQRDRSHYLAQAQRTLTRPAVVDLLNADGLGDVPGLIQRGDVGALRRLMAQSSRQGPGYLFAVGELALMDGDLERAEAMFRGALAEVPTLGCAWNRMGDLSQARGDLNEAINLYKKALVFEPNDANGYEDLGDLFATLGQTDKAKRMYEQALHHDPKGGAKRKIASLVEPDQTTERPVIGKIGVLGWAPHGGSVSPLEAVAISGSGQLIFSGNVGPVGREAGLVAFSCLKAKASDLGIEAVLTQQDLHLHFTDTEFGKDGPSSGLALTLAGASAYCRRPLKSALAATGEITVMGEVKPVGGIHEKVIAARLAGVRTILLPRRNMIDARALPEEVRVHIELIFVNDVAEALSQAWGD